MKLRFLIPVLGLCLCVAQPVIFADSCCTTSCCDEDCCNWICVDCVEKCDCCGPCCDDCCPIKCGDDSALQIELYKAILKDDAQKIKMLVVAGIDVDKKINGMWPISIAVGMEHYRAIKALIECGADCDLCR